MPLHVYMDMYTGDILYTYYIMYVMNTDTYYTGGSSLSSN